MPKDRGITLNRGFDSQNYLWRDYQTHLSHLRNGGYDYGSFYNNLSSEERQQLNEMIQMDHSYQAQLTGQSFEQEPFGSDALSNQVINRTNSIGPGLEVTTPNAVDALTQDMGSYKIPSNSVLRETSPKSRKSLSDGAIQGITVGSDLIAGMFGNKQEYNGPKGHITSTLDTAYDSLSQAAGNIPGIGSYLKLGLSTNKLLGNVLNHIGAGTSGMTGMDAFLGSSFMQMTPLGLINGFGGRKADTITKDTEAFAAVGPSYGGTESVVNSALEKSGAKYGAFSSGARHQANREIAEAKRQQNIMGDIASTATDTFNLGSSMSAIYGNAYNNALSGNYNQASVRVGRRGLSLKTIMLAKRAISKSRFQKKRKLQDISEEYPEPLDTVEEITLDSILPEFREGGKVNIIPEGALHARLHHMENADNLTKKGIPVVAEKEGGELEQQAEIERNEVILRLGLTQELEKLRKKYESSEYTQKEKDQFAIEAGKLLTYELLENTVDNTGLLNEV